MPRPKKAKPDQDTAEPTAPAPQPFNYEDSDAVYEQMMRSTAMVPGAAPGTMPEPAEPEPVWIPHNMPASMPATMSPEKWTGTITPVMPQAMNNDHRMSVERLFLVEGQVRLEQINAHPIVADQRRIVNASDIDEAIQKFINYFNGMSNEIQRYTVISAGGSETIV